MSDAGKLQALRDALMREEEAAGLYVRFGADPARVAACHAELRMIRRLRWVIGEPSVSGSAPVQGPGAEPVSTTSESEQR